MGRRRDLSRARSDGADLLLPTALAPNVLAALLAAFPGHVVPCSAARLVEPARLEAWLG